ncbi:MAG: hypothetical protein IKF19_01865 [Bacilli bacterium]|nr:hypothetical protein [Bacilli bacterium]
MINKFDLQIIDETLEELKNNSESCTLTGGKSKEGIFIIPELIPSIKLEKFIKHLYDNNLTDKDYLENNKVCEKKAFKELTLNEAITRLTFIIRGDRFCSGLLKSKIDDGSFLKLVEIIEKNIKNKPN